PFIHCFELLLFAIPAHPPILVPDPLLHLAHACDPGASSIHMFHVIELSTFQIAERQVCQIDVTDIPRSGLSRRAIHSLPEKRALEAELASFASSYVAGVIPPLRLKLLVIEVVPREFISIAGHCLFVLPRGGPRQQCDRGANRDPTLHE